MNQERIVIGEQIVRIATNEIGYSETPINSNKTKYGQWFGLDGVAWCGIFVSWVYTHAGLRLGNIGFKKGFAGCQTAVAYFKKQGSITKEPMIGDIVFFDWNGDGRFDHTGIFVRQIDSSSFETIEGNTSLTNQSNGGQVMRRMRKYSTAIFVHPQPSVIKP
jgi:hypothetical protein